jgi:NAD(P)-dependent dehydrogenase (short-subunit alcohol dehydrogenase family)
MSTPVAVVTGASRGIGKQLCVDLAATGYDIVCAARTTSDHPSKLPGSVEETAAAVIARGRRAMPIGLDVRSEDAIEALAERVFQNFGRCDLLVNNAAIAPPLPALEDSTKRWRLAVDVNLNGPFYLMYYFCRRMRHGEGRVINVSSGASFAPDFGRPSYTATKRGLEGLTEGLAYELRGKIALNVLRLDLMVWSEGFADTLPQDVDLPFEDPVIMSDAVLWIANQPITVSGEIFTITGLRAKGIVRPVTRYPRGKEDLE